MMTLVLDRGPVEPIYEQIARHIRMMAARGLLPPGTRLPSMRNLASDLGVNLNTVARARIRSRNGIRSSTAALRTRWFP